MNDLDAVATAMSAPETLVRAIGSGSRQGATPRFRKVELRPVRIKNDVRLQITRHDEHRPTVSNVDFPATDELSELLAEPYRHWLVETVDATLQLRFTKRGKTQLHTAPASRTQRLEHDRVAPHLIAADDTLFGVLGASAAKRRQVDAFLRAVEGATRDLAETATVVDLGCGNAYLTFAMHRHLVQSGYESRTIGVDVREDQRDRNTRLAGQLGWSDDMRFVAGSIADVELPSADIVLALHACDTATDDALARGVRLGARHIFAAPCCHHDIAAQLRGGTAPAGYRPLVGDGILRERFADVLTDTLRAQLLRMNDYRVDVVEFIDSAHTPRNTLIRGTRTDHADTGRAGSDYERLVAEWNVTPALARLLDS